jgi:hypothetical protein
MGLPTLLRFQRRQRVMRTILRCILDRVIVEAQRVGKLGRTIDTTYDILFPEIDVADHQPLANGVYYLTQSLVAAKAQGWVSDQTAMRLLFKFAGEEIDIHGELATLANEQRRKGEGDHAAR